MTPRELIAAGECTAACIAASTANTRTCRCPCGGRHHGVVADACISTLLEARAAGLHLLTDQELIA